MTKLITILTSLVILTGCTNIPVIGGNLDPTLAVNESFEMTPSERAATYRPTMSCEEIKWNIFFNKSYIKRASNQDAHTASSFFWTLNIPNGMQKWNNLKTAKENLKLNEDAYAVRCK